MSSKVVKNVSNKQLKCLLQKCLFPYYLHLPLLWLKKEKSKIASENQLQVSMYSFPRKRLSSIMYCGINLMSSDNTHVVIQELSSGDFHLLQPNSLVVSVENLFRGWCQGCSFSGDSGVLGRDLIYQCQVPQLGSCHDRGVGDGRRSHVQNWMETIRIGHILNSADAISGVNVRELSC